MILSNLRLPSILPKIFLFSIVLSANCFAGDEQFKPLVKQNTKNYNENANICCFVDWGISGWLNKDIPFPDAKLLNLRTNKYVSISSLAKKRPIVLQMGSVTCPSYEINIKYIEYLRSRYKGKIDFYTVYVRENHPTQKFGAHTSFQEKRRFAQALKTDSRINHEILIDDINGSFHQMLGNFGNSIYLIGTDMHINHWSIFPNAAKLDLAIQSMIKANGVGKNADYVAGIDTHPMFSFGYSPKEKKDVTAVMSKREGISSILSEKDVLAKYQKFTTDNPEVANTISEKMKNKLISLSVQASNINKIKENRSVVEEKYKMDFKELQKSFKEEYRSRIKSWSDMNKLPIDSKAIETAMPINAEIY